MGKRGLIIIPYAYGGNTGVSIQNVDRQLEIYMKNVSVAALSAKHNAGADTDVAVVSNIDIPLPYADVLSHAGVLNVSCPFDRFNFGTHTKSGEKVRWQLAFYKLCALAHCVKKIEYNNYCFLDSDVFVQGSFDQIWYETQHNIMLYDLNEPADGYMVKEMRDYLKTERLLTHYGGEFFAASRQLTEELVNQCQQVFNEMGESDYMTRSGDEFITSIVADRMKPQIKNAAAYINRYWTGSYRKLCNNFDNKSMVVLHVPAEKEQGILRLYNKYIQKGFVPTNNTVGKILHLKHTSIRVRTGVFLRSSGVIK